MTTAKNTARPPAIAITVRLFASYREKVGAPTLQIEIPAYSTVGWLANHLVELHPRLIGDPSHLVVAVNEEYRDHAVVLQGGDEVALIPPVSGGSR